MSYRVTTDAGIAHATEAIAGAPAAHTSDAAAPQGVAAPTPAHHGPSFASRALPPTGFTLGGAALGAGVGALVSARLAKGGAMGAAVGAAAGAASGIGAFEGVRRLMPKIDYAQVTPYVWGLYGREDEAGAPDDPRVEAARRARRTAWVAGIGGGSALGAAGGLLVSWLARRPLLAGVAIGGAAGAGLGAAALKGLSSSLQGLTDTPPAAADSHVGRELRADGPRVGPVDPHAPPAPGDMSLGSHFFMGTTTSATQAEGGGIDNDVTRWGATHADAGWAPFNPGVDHWNRIDRDYQHLHERGHNAHGLTVDWARIEPQEGVFDQAAIAHYRKEIETSRAQGMEPMVTLLQYALPPWLADKGGYLAPDATERFEEFTRVVAENLGDQVTWWNTLNEPNTVAAAGYFAGIWAPGEQSPIKMARVMDAQLHMHAAAANTLHEVAREHGRDAKVGIAYLDDRVYPAQDWNPLDQAASGLFDYVGNRWFLDSIAAGRSLSPLGDGKPIAGLQHSLDYIGLDFYGRDWGHLSPGGGFGTTTNPAEGDSPRAFDVEGMYELTTSVWNQLHVPVMITESGIDMPGADPNNVRGRALVDSLAAIHHAQADGVPVLGYLYWTDWDSPEWADGWKQHYGMFGFDHDTSRRYDRPVANTFEAIARRGTIPQQWLSADDLQSPADRDSHAAHERDVLRSTPGGPAPAPALASGGRR